MDPFFEVRIQAIEMQIPFFEARIPFIEAWIPVIEMRIPVIELLIPSLKSADPFYWIVNPLDYIAGFTNWWFPVIWILSFIHWIPDSCKGILDFWIWKKKLLYRSLLFADISNISSLKDKLDVVQQFFLSTERPNRKQLLRTFLEYVSNAI